ncbi:MAG: DUF5615 family PIN-like protein [Phycisphaeraceae bacterium]|nr:DUF5615 family PIN-like protein [Phycisphaeraceae bacterium]
MKLLLDENLPTDLRHFLAGHEVFTVAYMQWKGVRNGELFKRAAEAGFDAVITLDAGIEHDYAHEQPSVAVVIVRGRGCTLDSLRHAIPALLDHLQSLRPRTVTVIG